MLLSFAIWCILERTLVAENVMTIENKGKIRNPFSATEMVSTESKTSVPGKWISQLFQQAEANFSLISEVSDQCTKDYQTYKEYLQKHSVWAIRMMESSEWPVVGIFYGRTYHTGSWRECLVAKGAGVQGKYCLVEALLELKFDIVASHSTSHWADWPQQNTSVWNELGMFEKQPVRINRRQQHWALCVPSSCTNSDLKKSLNSTLYPLFKENSIDIAVDVNPRLCKIQQKEHFSSGFYYTVLLLVIIMLLVILASVFSSDGEESKEKAENQLHRNLLKCFSVQQNFRNLTSLGSNSYPVIYGIKLFYICLIIHAHRVMYQLSIPKTETEFVETLYDPSAPEITFDVIVDAFFMISGFITFYLGIVPMSKGGVYYLIFSILVRWLRMIPVFGVLMLFIIYILPHLGDGPFWDIRILREAENCKANWWTNLLAINNIVNPDKQCLILSYYIAVDIQLAVLGTILLYVVTKNAKIGVVLTVFTCLVSCVVTFIVVYSNKYSGQLLLTMRLFEDPRRSEEFRNFYAATYSRAGPYIIGCLAGYVAMFLKRKNTQFYETWRYYVVLWPGLLLGYLYQMYAFKFYEVEQPYWPLENALFGATHRLLFVLPIAFFICVYVSTGVCCVFHKTMFAHNICVPLGRLVYGALLGGFVFQLYTTSIVKMPVSVDHRIEGFMFTISDIVFSYLIAFFMYLTLEGPINSLTKLAISSVFKLHPEEQGHSPTSNNNECKPPC